MTYTIPEKIIMYRTKPTLVFDLQGNLRIVNKSYPVNASNKKLCREKEEYVKNINLSIVNNLRSWLALEKNYETTYNKTIQEILELYPNYIDDVLLKTFEPIVYNNLDTIYKKIQIVYTSQLDQKKNNEYKIITKNNELLDLKKENLNYFINRGNIKENGIIEDDFVFINIRRKLSLVSVKSKEYLQAKEVKVETKPLKNLEIGKFYISSPNRKNKNKATELYLGKFTVSEYETYYKYISKKYRSYLKRKYTTDKYLFVTYNELLHNKDDFKVKLYNTLPKRYEVNLSRKYISNIEDNDFLKLCLDKNNTIKILNDRSIVTASTAGLSVYTKTLWFYIEKAV